jgi:pilus assembly protein Flp/PilA
MRLLKRLLNDSTGASAAEYALLLGIIGAAIGLAALALGGSISNAMNRSSGQIRNCGGGC